jgi:hypothetical protein
MAKSTLVYQALNGKVGTMVFSADIDETKVESALDPLTSVMFTKKTETVETTPTTSAAKTVGEGDKSRKLVCTFRHVPATGDPSIHRISIPAPIDTALSLKNNGDSLYLNAKDATGEGGTTKDGEELAELFKGLLGIPEGEKFLFLQGRMYQKPGHK